MCLPVATKSRVSRSYSYRFALFTHSKYDYKWKDTRVGQHTDYDKLRFSMDRWEHSLREAINWARVLSKHLSLFINLTEEVAEVEILDEKEEDDKAKVLEMTDEELDLSVRSITVSNGRN